MEVSYTKLVLYCSVMVICNFVSSYAARSPNITNCPDDSYYVTDNDFVVITVSEPRPTEAWLSRPGALPISISRMVDGYHSQVGSELRIPIGLSETVTYTFTDSRGYQEQCIFTVTAIDHVYCNSNMCQNGTQTCIIDTFVNLEFLCVCPRGFYGEFCQYVDLEPPVITNCPTHGFIGFAPDDGTSSNLVSWLEPTVTDDSAISIDKSHEPLTRFRAGENQVVYTFVDEAQNIARCSFIVTIHVGYWILYDGEKPQIFHCPLTNVVLELDPGETEAVVGWSDPWATDNSGKIPRKQNNIGPMSKFPLGRTRVEYIFTDDQSNSAECVFDIILLNDETPQEIIENDWDIINCPTSTIMANIPPNENSVMVGWNEPTAVSRSGQRTFNAYKTHSPMSGFPIGGTEVTYLFQASDGTTEECKFTIFISQGVDNPPPPIIAIPEEAPVIAECPTDIIATLPFGTTEAIVDWKEPQAYSPVNKPITVTKTHEPSSTFLVRVLYTVQYDFTDADGLVNICRFDINLNVGPMKATLPLNDKTPPKIYDCPENIAGTTPDATNMASIMWVEPYATDNSGVTPTMNRTHKPTDRFDLGQTMVTYTFTDLSGNKQTCSFSITIDVDTEPPKITNCLQSFSIHLSINQNHAKIYWPEPYASDNSGIGPSVDQTFHPGDMLSVGKSTITYTFTDLANNRAVCLFDITVTEPLCEHKGLSYSNRQTARITDCSECLCFLGIWYCRKLCSETCPLIYPDDSGICSTTGGPFTPGIPCNTDLECASLGTTCCANVCDGRKYCSKPTGSQCFNGGTAFNDGATLKSHDDRFNGYTKCTCTFGDWICVEVKIDGCMYDGIEYRIGETRLKADGCNSCFCTDTHWSCTRNECGCANVECPPAPDNSACTPIQAPGACCPTYNCPFVTNVGTCPSAPIEPTGSCVETCQHDGYCAGQMKCCNNGCARVCMGPAQGVVTCATRPCLNGGTCQNTFEGTFCTCSPGFSGERCEQASVVGNACNLTPCQNGGQCMTLPNNGYVCICTAPYAGLNCQNGPLPDFSFCMYNGIRYESGSSITIAGCTNCYCQNAHLSCDNSPTCPVGRRKKRSTKEFIGSIISDRKARNDSQTSFNLVRRKSTENS